MFVQKSLILLSIVPQVVHCTYLMAECIPPYCVFLQLTCPIPQDQLSLLRLLSSHANQVFSYRSSGSEVEFVGANGEAPDEQVNAEKVCHSSCDA